VEGLLRRDLEQRFIQSDYQNYTCPNCGKALRQFVRSGFCEGCGQSLKVESVLSPDATRKRSLSITIWELVVLAVAFITKENGATLVGALVVFMLVSALGVGLIIVWVRGVKPTARTLREEGIVGLGWTVEKKIVEPILYGRRGKSHS
jgi:hypothetical protein